jgi:hypothetical protein
LLNQRHKRRYSSCLLPSCFFALFVESPFQTQGPGGGRVGGPRPEVTRGNDFCRSHTQRGGWRVGRHSHLRIEATRFCPPQTPLFGNGHRRPPPHTLIIRGPVVTPAPPRPSWRCGSVPGPSETRSAKPATGRVVLLGGQLATGRAVLLLGGQPRPVAASARATGRAACYWAGSPPSSTPNPQAGQPPAFRPGD